MKKLLFLVLLLCSILRFAAESQAACPGGICEPLTCNQAGVEAFVAMNAADGDTVQLPACGPTDWGANSNGFDPAVGVMLQGEPCTIGDSDRFDNAPTPRNIQIALSCPTNLVDAAASFGVPLINMPVPACAHPCSYQVGMRHIAWTSLGLRQDTDSVMYFFPPCCAQSFEDGRRVKLEYLRFVNFGPRNGKMFTVSEWGAAAHIYWLPPIDMGGYLLQHQMVGTAASSTRADQRVSSPNLFGREDAFTVESSVVIARWSATVYEARMVDSGSSGGARVAIRNNYIEGFHIDSHGTESGIRGPHYFEWYGNRFEPLGTDYPTMGHIRTGGVLAHSNVQNSSGFASGTPIARLVDYRDGQWGKGYEETSGHSNIDEGSGSNPLVTCTTTAHTSSPAPPAQPPIYYTVTIDLGSCTGNTALLSTDLGGYFIHQVGCTPRWDISCSITINSISGNIIRFRPNLWDAIDHNADPRYAAAKTLLLNPAGGDTIHIDEVLNSFDSPCRTGATTFDPSYFATNLTYSSGTGKATLTASATMASLGIANGDYVLVDSDWQDTTDPVGCGVNFCGFPYRGVFQVSEVSGSTFKFVPYRVPSGDGTGSTIEFKKRLGTATNQISRCYEFQNFDSSNNAIHFYTGISSGEGALYKNLRISDGIVSSPVVFNWVGTSTTVGVQTSPTSPFNGTYGVGVGTIANRPTTCSVGVLYRATDVGEWDSTNGATADGRNDLCTETDTWTNDALPHLAFPHPLISDVGGITSITPSSGVQGASLNNVAFVGEGFDCAGFSVPTFSGLTITDVVVTDTNNMRWDIAIAADATVGNRSLYFNCTAGASNGSTFTVNASADTTAPTPGNSGTITSPDATSNQITAVWTKGTDNVSAAGALQYEVRRSSTNNMGSVANAEANGTICLNYTTDIATANCTGLSPSTTYWIQVILKDEAGNKNIYTQTSFMTDAEPGSPPSVGGAGFLTTLNVSTTSLTLLWFAATDNDTPQNLLEYSIRRSASNNITSVTDAETNGTLILDYTPISPVDDAISIPIGSLNPGTTYYWNVIVRDQEGEKAAYTPTSATMVQAPGAVSGARFR